MSKFARVGRAIKPVAIVGALGVATFAVLLAAEPTYRRTEDVVYGRKFGSALTFDVFRPRERANGLGVVAVMSGGWYSDHRMIDPGVMQGWTDRGYTVFAVVHGSQPRYTIPEIVGDMNRAVRFIRVHAAEYGVDPDQLAITGSSAGGHLSLMIGTAGGPGDPNAADPVDRASSRVQAVACFFPPTDFLNYGKPGETAIGEGTLKDYAAPFDFQTFDEGRKRFERITDRAEVERIARAISPITHATADDPPTLIVHGDADLLVPIQQSEILVAKLKASGVDAQLITKPGAVHGWRGMDRDLATFADWFDAHLRAKPGTPAPKP